MNRYTASDADEKFIQQLWADEECIDLNSIQYGNGLVVLLTAPDSIPTVGDSISIAVDRFTTAERAAKLPGVTLSVGLARNAINTITRQGRKIMVTAGECASYGTFGYVAAYLPEDDSLVWLAMFLQSNPFVEVSPTNHSVTATTNLGVRYIFPWDCPEAVVVLT